MRTPTAAARAFKAEVERYVEQIAHDPKMQGAVKALRHELELGTFDQEPLDVDGVREYFRRHRPS